MISSIVYNLTDVEEHNEKVEAAEKNRTYHFNGTMKNINKVYPLICIWSLCVLRIFWSWFSDRMGYRIKAINSDVGQLINQPILKWYALHYFYLKKQNNFEYFALRVIYS